MAMTYGIIQTKIWNSRDFRALTAEGKVLFLYLLTNPSRSIIGAYPLPIRHIRADIDMNEASLIELMDKMPDVTYSQECQWVVIENYLRYNQLPNSNYLKGAIKLIRSAPNDRSVLMAVERSMKWVKEFEGGSAIAAEVATRIKNAPDRKASLPGSEGEAPLDGMGMGYEGALDGISSPLNGGMPPANKIMKINAMRALNGLAPLEDSGSRVVLVRENDAKGLPKMTEGALDGIERGFNKIGKIASENGRGFQIAGSPFISTPSATPKNVQKNEHDQSVGRDTKGLPKTGVTSSEMSEKRDNVLPFVTPGPKGLPVSEKPLPVSPLASHTKGLTVTGRTASDQNEGPVTTEPNENGVSVKTTDLTEGACIPSEGASKIVENNSKNDDFKKTDEPSDSLRGVSPFEGDIHQSNQSVGSDESLSGQSSGGGLAGLRLNTKYKDTSYLREGVQGESSASEFDAELAALDQDAFESNRPDARPSGPEASLPAVARQAPLFEGMPDPADEEDLHSDNSEASRKGSASPKKKTERDFPQNLFIENVCALWNEIVHPRGGELMTVYSKKFDVSFRKRYAEAQKMPPGIVRKITTLEDWARFFHHITKSSFLMGMGEPSGSQKTPWSISLMWLIQSSENFGKVRSGRYHKPEGMMPVGEFEMPDLRSIPGIADFKGF